MAREEATSGGQRVLGSVDRAVRVLDVLAAEAAGLPLAELARRLGTKPQTLQSLLRSLQAHDLVIQLERGGKYSLGPHVHHLSRQWLGLCDRATLAREVVTALAERVRETVLLADLRAGRLFALVHAEARRALAVSQDHLFHAPLHTTATGKLLLAFLPDRERDRLIEGLDLSPRGPRSITDAGALRRELDHVRAEGIAVCNEEADEHVAALAVPIRRADGAVAAALGVSLPSARYDARTHQRLLADLAAAGTEIARRWGEEG